MRNYFRNKKKDLVLDLSHKAPHASHAGDLTLILERSSALAAHRKSISVRGRVSSPLFYSVVYGSARIAAFLFLLSAVVSGRLRTQRRNIAIAVSEIGKPIARIGNKIEIVE